MQMLDDLCGKTPHMQCKFSGSDTFDSQPSALASSCFRCKELKTNTAAVATRNKDAQRISSLTQTRCVFVWFQQSHSSWLL